MLRRKEWGETTIEEDEQCTRPDIMFFLVQICASHCQEIRSGIVSALLFFVMVKREMLRLLVSP